MTDEKATVRITKGLYDEIERKIRSKDLQFDTVDAFVEFALSDVLDVTPAKAMTKEDEDEVSRRLAAFGY